MKTVKPAIGIVVLCIIVASCSKNSNSKVLFEKDFSTGHADWTVSGDTIVKQFELQFRDSKEPLKVYWLNAKDPSGCLEVSYARIERIHTDSNFNADNIKAEPGMCGTDWESSDPTRYNQMIFTGTLKKSDMVKKNVKMGHFLTIKGNGKLQVIQ